MNRERRSPTSVILPTFEWNPACEELTEQLAPRDELLIVCDSERDPVARKKTPENVRILVAGEPEGCSGKANAVAHGMEHAENDRFVWTDDDFNRDSDWLARLVQNGEEHGPSTVIPVFMGDGWWRIYEPWVTLTSSFSFYTGYGPWGGNAWGGGVTFTQEDVDVDRLATDLRRSLSDDGLLSDRIDDIYPIRSSKAFVELCGDFRSVKERMIRYIRITHVHEGAIPVFTTLLLLSVIAVIFPIITAITLTAIMAIVYVILGLRRWTFLVTFPGLFLAAPTTLAGIFVNEFDWAGRRYRLNGMFDVEVVRNQSEDPERK